MSGASPRSYVALGDSFVRGVDTASWTDHVADGLRRENPALEYRNLGIVGATAEAIAAAPLDEAVALQPDLVTVLCGANDVLLNTKPDIDAFRAAYVRILDRLRNATGAAVMTATYPDGARLLPLRPRTLARVERGLAEVNEIVVEESERFGVPCVQGHRPGEHPVEGNFGRDGFHPSAEGHRKIYRVMAEHIFQEFGFDSRGAAAAGEQAA